MDHTPSHVLVWKRGKKQKSAPGLALWFAPLGAIQENELANKIELTRREAELIQQRGQNEKKKKAEDDSEARRIAAEGAARDQRLGADADAAGIASWRASSRRSIT